jgi:hypothetical protein
MSRSRSTLNRNTEFRNQVSQLNLLAHQDLANRHGLSRDSTEGMPAHPYHFLLFLKASVVLANLLISVVAYPHDGRMCFGSRVGLS